MVVSGRLGDGMVFRVVVNGRFSGEGDIWGGSEL